MKNLFDLIDRYDATDGLSVHELPIPEQYRILPDLLVLERLHLVVNHRSLESEPLVYESVLLVTREEAKKMIEEEMSRILANV